MTRTALSFGTIPAPVKIGVWRIVSVALRATVFVLVMFTRVATPRVLPLGDCLQVGGVTAGAVTAQVVDYQALRDRANHRFVNNSMG